MATNSRSRRSTGSGRSFRRQSIKLANDGIFSSSDPVSHEASQPSSVPLRTIIAADWIDRNPFENRHTTIIPMFHDEILQLRSADSTGSLGQPMPYDGPCWDQVYRVKNYWVGVLRRRGVKSWTK